MTGTQESLTALIQQESEAEHGFKNANRIAEQTSGTLHEQIAQAIPAFRSFYSFVDFLIEDRSTYTQGAIIHGHTGIGKSDYILKRLARVNDGYHICNSFTTPLALYIMLYRNNGKIIVLDDVADLLNSHKSVAILKSALFSASGERLITYESTTKILQDNGVPSQFVFTGKIIIILNQIPATFQETFLALINRVFAYHITLTLKQKLILITLVFNHTKLAGIKDEDKTKLLELINKLSSFSNVHKCNVRTALRAASIVASYGGITPQAILMIEDLLEVDVEMAQYAIVEEETVGMPVGKQAEIWIETTGYSRRQFFYIKRKADMARKMQRAMLEDYRKQVKELAVFTK